MVKIPAFVNPMQARIEELVMFVTVGNMLAMFVGLVMFARIEVLVI